MSIKTKLKLNLNLLLITAAYLTAEWYEPAIRSALTLGPMPM